MRTLGMSAACVMVACASQEAPQPSSAPDRDGETVVDAGTTRDASVARRDASPPPQPDAATRPPGVTEPLDPNDPLVGGKPPPTPKAGCGKIDFLFVVDNSGSMSDEQENLIRSFPGFLDTIRASVAASDHHLLVTDTDASGSMSSQSSTCSGNTCSCTPAETCCLSICSGRPGGSCNGSPCSNPSTTPPCDVRLGAGRVKDAMETRCIPDAPRFVASSAPNLETKFSCMARVGTNGDGNERPMQAIAEAVGPLARDGQCNAGFLRDDAILVVTFITDEEDAPGQSPGGPSEWIANLIEAKGGNEDAVVVLGVFGDSDRANSTCAPGGLMGNLGANPGPRLRAFVEGFKYGVAGSVCAADYAPFFQQAVEVIDLACDQFTQ